MLKDGTSLISAVFSSQNIQVAEKLNPSLYSSNTSGGLNPSVHGDVYSTRPRHLGVIAWCNQCRGVLLIWIIVGQGHTALTVCAGGGYLDISFSHLSFLFSCSLFSGRCPDRLKYCLKGP